MRKRSEHHAAVITARARVRSMATSNEIPRRAEQFAIEILMREGLHGLHRVERFARARAGVGDAVLAAAAQGAHPAPEQDERHHDEQHGADHERRQLQAGHEHQREAADEHDGIAHGDGRGRADDGLDERRVRGEPRQHFAGARHFEEGRRQPDHVIEHGLADVGDHALAQPGDEIEAPRNT
jgi:hypothetical protein